MVVAPGPVEQLVRAAQSAVVSVVGKLVYLVWELVSQGTLVRVGFAEFVVCLGPRTGMMMSHSQGWHGDSDDEQILPAEEPSGSGHNE